MQISKFGLIVLLILAALLFYKCSHADTAVATMKVSATVAANPKNGKAIFESTCVECHDASDFSDTSVAEIKGVVDSTKHKVDLTLSQKQIEDLVTYLQTYY